MYKGGWTGYFLEARIGLRESRTHFLPLSYTRATTTTTARTEKTTSHRLVHCAHPQLRVASRSRGTTSSFPPRCRFLESRNGIDTPNDRKKLIGTEGTRRCVDSVLLLFSFFHLSVYLARRIVPARQILKINFFFMLKLRKSEKTLVTT